MKEYHRFNLIMLAVVCSMFLIFLAGCHIGQYEAGPNTDALVKQARSDGIESVLKAIKNQEDGIELLCGPKYDTAGNVIETRGCWYEIPGEFTDY